MDIFGEAITLLTVVGNKEMMGENFPELKKGEKF